MSHTRIIRFVEVSKWTSLVSALIAAAVARASSDIDVGELDSESAQDVVEHPRRAAVCILLANDVFAGGQAA